MHISHTKSFNIPVSIADTTLAHMINVYEICFNTTNYLIFNMQDFRYCLWTSLLDCFGQLVSPPWYLILRTLNTSTCVYRWTNVTKHLKKLSEMNCSFSQPSVSYSTSQKVCFDQCPNRHDLFLPAILTARSRVTASGKTNRTTSLKLYSSILEWFCSSSQSYITWLWMLGLGACPNGNINSYKDNL